MMDGKERITRTDVARDAGVSESTVSRALSDSPRISQAIKERVRDTAVGLGYIPNRQASLLAKNRTYRIGLVVHNYKSFTPFTRSYFPRLLDGTVQEAERRGFSVTIMPDTEGDHFKDLSLPVRSREVDGLVFSVTPMKDPRFEELKNLKVPFVLVNNLVEGMYCVNCDAGPGMRDAFNHLLSLGHRKITYITGDTAYWDGAARLEIFRALAEEHHIPLHVVRGDFSLTRGQEAAREIFNGSKPPTAVICASDRSAIGVMRFCRETGIRIPGDLSLVGFDNLDPEGDAVPGLTTVHQPVASMGGEATGMLIDLLDGRPTEPERFVESGFIIRETTGRPEQRKSGVRKEKQ